MSVRSDDTDLLLLIPPDFFSVKEDCVKKPDESLLVSDLITQVNDLEGRICMIENQSLIMPGNLTQLRHYGSADTLNTSYKSNYNLRSLQTTPLKTHTLPSPCKTWRKGSPSKYSKRTEQHQNMLESYEYLNQKERDDKLLKEINDFFKHKSNEEEKSESESFHLSTAVFNLNKVNDLLKQLEETQAEIEAKLKLKGLNGESDLDETDNLQPVLKSSRSPRRLLEFDCPSPGKETKDVIVDTGESVDSQKPEENESEMKNLLSLCNLWGSKNADDGKVNDDPNALKQKYEEEKCRRQHCEELIQKLQLKLLEEQQKVAVAIKVDKEKDEAISKLTEGWNKLLSNWRELENQKNVFAKKLQLEREKFQNEVSIAHQTVKRYETELSKALDLAHGYKEKCELSEQERKNAIKELENLKGELREKYEKTQKEQLQVEKLEKLVMAKEESLNQSRAKILEMQNQIRELRRVMKDLQTEIEILKHEKEKVVEKLKEEKNRMSGMEQSKKSLAQMNEDLKKKEKSLKENVKSLTEQMDKMKIDLKEFYQEQVEKIVQEKLKEFQEQLGNAEKSLQKELEERERTVTEMAVKQVQQIVEKHVQEVNLLEEKHKEEIELWKTKMAQTEVKVKDLQTKLEHYSSHKTEIAQKLQTVLETQWQEALKIITACSPQHVKADQNTVKKKKAKKRQNNNRDQTLRNCSPLHSARSDSDKELPRQNIYTMLSCGWGKGNLNKNGTTDTESHSDPPNSEPPNSELPFFKDGQLTFREQTKSDQKMTYRIDETPQKIDSGTVDPLKKYIEMLLERPPGLPVDDPIDNFLDSSLFNSITGGSSAPQWQHVLSERFSHGNSEPTKPEVVKHLKGKENKIPWK